MIPSTVGGSERMKLERGRERQRILDKQAFGEPGQRQETGGEVCFVPTPVYDSPWKF